MTASAHRSRPARTDLPASHPGNLGRVDVALERAGGAVVKAVDRAPATAGDTVTYSVTVAPDVTGTALTFTVNDDLPTGLTLLPGTVVAMAGSTAVSGDTVTWTLAQPANAAGGSHSFQATVAPGTAGQTLVNGAASTTSDPDDVLATSEASLYVVPP